MATRTVNSPAGESVQILSDEEWMAISGTEIRGLRQWHGAKPAVIRALWEHGQFTNKSGGATLDLVEYARRYGEGFTRPSKALSALWLDPLNQLVTEREIRGKRTFKIKLIAMPEMWYGKLRRDIENDSPQVEPEPVPEPVAVVPTVEPVKESPANANGNTEWSEADWEALQLDAPTVYEQPPPLELHIANQVAMSLLTSVVEIITAGTADTAKLSGSRKIAEDLDHVQGLLAMRLEENERMRRQLREAGDTITAVRQERDGLRTRLRMVEHNLSQALKGETAHAVNTEIHKRIDQFMRVAPPTNKGDE